jgi:hypothetical protein
MEIAWDGFDPAKRISDDKFAVWEQAWAIVAQMKGLKQMRVRFKWPQYFRGLRNWEILAGPMTKVRTRCVPAYYTSSESLEGYVC